MIYEVQGNTLRLQRKSEIPFSNPNLGYLEYKLRPQTVYNTHSNRIRCGVIQIALIQKILVARNHIILLDRIKKNRYQYQPAL